MTLPWRDHLTPDERATIEAADAAKAEWQRLNAVRAGIVNRAIQRAKYRGTALSAEPGDHIVAQATRAAKVVGARSRAKPNENNSQGEKT